MKSYTKEKLLALLNVVDWSSVLLSCDVNFCLREFVRLFSDAVNAAAPMRDVRVKRKENPWMNADILSRIKRRDVLLAKFRKNRGNENLYKAYCVMRNAVQRDIKLAKRYYFEKQVEQSKGDSGKLWASLRSLGYSAKGGGASTSIVLEQEGVQISEPSAVANAFNRFYTSVASNLVSRLPSASGAYSIFDSVFRHFHFNPSRYCKSFTLTPVSRGCILKLLYSLNPKKAVGLDGISSRFLCDGASSIVEPISHLINISILTETVPDDFKRAKIIPM